jgi:hypothetical protein
LIRYTDDAVLGFSEEEDARRVLAVLPSANDSGSTSRPSS